MNNTISTLTTAAWSAARIFRPLIPWLTVVALAVVTGCGTSNERKQKQDFFTSGSREADQRASQRMAKDEQLAGTGEGTEKKDSKKAKSSADDGKPSQVENKLTLYERLGGEKVLTAIIDDFTPRVLQDPRVDWQRKGEKRSGFLFRREQTVAWNQTPENVATLKRHFVQFLALATGGPAKYDGKEIKSVHADMHIGNPEFDAVIGDFKASLDRLKIADKEQKELLAIIESTRPQIVTVR